VFGNLAQGFSVSWWKDKHNRHHAVPNVHGGPGGSLFADPDVDTMPLLAWSDKMASLAKDSAMGRRMVSVQKYTYLPLLCVARFSWLHAGIQFAWQLESELPGFIEATKNEDLKKVQKVFLSGPQRRMEQALLIVHHAWVFALCAQRPTVASALGFYLLAQATCGLILFAVTSLGHNGLPVYEADARPDYWKLQVTTTRNISGNWFVHWLCGGLEYQVDHHLFPMMPRHSLPKAHELIVSFCAEHGIKYNEANLWAGTLDVIEHLDVVAKDFFKEFPAM
jgi:fatty acid desaturase